MMRTSDGSGATGDASEADVQEQQRPALEDGFDPEQTADTDPPDGSRADADPADLHEQSLEVPEDDDRPLE
ncbi:hypothetical protein [Microbacterium sp. AK031]|uniref:hypothetical protein n=1 Tax=Microbacterium sp. AK031 TaxID=2723076 RepID=UPI00216A0F01|nr:hypothetical protein [Microbacterium sp. AK031]MCS3844006.1 hypothetical protein [Microbacterium sp. AK031]